MKYDAAHVLASISKAKSKGHYPNDIRLASRPNDKVQMMIARFYEDYVSALKESNSLDFDDLLLYGVKLFTKERKTVTWCRHILVDEL
jgi:ATP-dependent DNA helicase UvrD/PcrA